MSTALERAPAPARRVGAWGTWGLAGAAGLATLAALRLGGPGALGAPACLMRSALHLSCPTCGLTRSLALLAAGDLGGSLAAHPLGLVLVVQAAAAWGLWGAWLAGGLRGRPDRWIPLAIAVNAAALLALWALRWLAGTLPPA